MMRWLLGCAAVALMAAGCGGSSKDSPTATQPPTAAQTQRANPTAAPSPSASPSPSVSPSPAADGAGDPASIAALKELGALYRSPLTRDGCLENNPDEKPCIELTSSAGGIAHFNGGDPAGGAFTFLMGTMSDGTWHFWLSSQQQLYVLSILPGDLRACGEVTVRTNPDAGAEAAGTLPDQGTADAEAFQLTNPGTYGPSGTRGDGWYRISAPVAGWVHASDTTDAKLGNCKLRDAIEGASPRG